MQAPSNAPECALGPKCAVCRAGPEARYDPDDDVHPEADFASLYAAIAAPYAPRVCLESTLACHGAALDRRAVHRANALYQACLEGDLPAVGWLCARLGFTTKTTLLEGLECVRLSALRDGHVVDVERAMGAACRPGSEPEYRKYFLFLCDLAARGHGDVVVWLLGFFAESQWMRRLAATNFEEKVDSVSAARRYVAAFGLKWGDIEAAGSPEPGDSLVVIAFMCNPGLLVWLVRELGCPAAAMKQALAKLKGGGAAGDLHAEYLALEAHLRVNGIDV